MRVGEAERPGPVPPFWSPLLDANITADTRKDYRSALDDFIAFANAWDDADAVESYGDLDYWLAVYSHHAYTQGTPKKYKVQRAVYACEFWLPECKPLVLARRNVGLRHRHCQGRQQQSQRRDK